MASVEENEIRTLFCKLDWRVPWCLDERLMRVKKTRFKVVFYVKVGRGSGLVQKC